MDDLQFGDSQVRSKRHGWFWLLVLGLPIAGVVIGVSMIGLSCSRLRSAAADVHDAIADARKAGLAVTNEDLKQGTGPRAHLQAAIGITESLRPKGVLEGFILFDEFGMIGGDSALSVAAALEPAIKELQAHLQLEPSGIDTNWDIEPEWISSYGSTFEWVGRALCLRGYASIGNGDWTSGLADFDTVAKLARRADSWPCEQGVQAANSCLRDSRAVLIALAHKHRNNAKWLVSLREAMAKFDGVVDPTQSIRGALLRDLTILRNFDLLRPYGPAWEYSYSRPGRQTLRTEFRKLVDHSEVPKLDRHKALMARYLRLMQPLWEQYEKSPVTRRDSPATWQAVIDHSRQSNDPIDSAFGLMENPFSEVDFAIRAQTRQVACLAMIDCLIYRQKTGAWPTTINDLPEKHVDLFRGIALSVTKKNGYFRVYSFGPNGFDDGGLDAAEASRARASSDDIVVLYPPGGYP
ncbi:MAG: hypothetical protein KF784_01510 [Fimbriimonadaceae bacterium]|nr:hypothetical protein [Fimbriimonadaceae bacterium]